MSRWDVTALGELLIDFAEAGEEGGHPRFTANPGGAPCNLLAALARLGHPVAFLGKVGDDLFGRQLRREGEAAGIDMGGLLADPAAPTTLAFVKNDERGERDFVFYRSPGADCLLRPEEVDAARIAGCRIFHFGSLSMTHAPARQAAEQAVALAERAGCLISFDPNWRPLLWKSEEDARERMAYGLSHSHIVKVAEEELRLLTGKDDPERGAADLLARYPGIRLLTVTFGAGGSRGYCGGLAAACPAFLLGGTVDTTGAGDVFGGCILDGVLRQGFPKTEDALFRRLRFANAAAYLVTTKQGALCSVPAKEEIEALL